MGNASEYANDIADDIKRMAERGAPFGVISRDTGDWSNDESDIQEWREGDGWDEATALDYLSDVLDIQYLVNSDRTYRAARILIAFGGPNAWIDTRTGQLEVTWWSAPEYRDLPREFIDGLDEALSELWEMGA